MEKNILKILFLSSLFVTTSFTQISRDESPIKLSADSLAKSYLSITSARDSSWHYSTEDNFSFALPDYDFTQLETINPYINLKAWDKNKSPEVIWLIKQIEIDSTMQNKSIGIMMHHDGASEIYFNGKLLEKYGTCYEEVCEEEAFDPIFFPSVITFDTTLVNTLAIRLSNRNAVEHEYLYTKFVGHVGVVIRLFDFYKQSQEVFKENYGNFAIQAWVVGFLLAFVLIFSLLYYFYSMQRENLYFTMFVLGILFIFLSSLLEVYFKAYFLFVVFLRFIAFIGITLVFIDMLLFLYQIVYQRVIKLFWVFLITFLVINLFSFFGSDSIFAYRIPMQIAIALLMIESIRVVAVGIKRKITYINILATGIVIFILMFLALTILNSVNNSYIPATVNVIVGVLAIFPVPLSMAFYLAKFFGKTNKDLEEQINTVKEMSAKQIQQERENAELKIKSERERIENERKSKELEEARRVQISMLPDCVPQVQNMDIAVYMQTATEVGGDYYDFYKSEAGDLTTVIGDATGHGLNAGMLVSVTKGIFQNLAPMPTLEKVISRFNSSLFSMKLQPLYMSLSLIRFLGNELNITSAGMPPFLYYQHNTGNVIEIEASGPPLGVFPNFDYGVRKYNLFSGDVIVLMSDGFPERRNTNEEMFGWDGGRKLLPGISHLTSEQIVAELVNASNKWGGERPNDDDITFVVFKVNNLL